MTTKQKEVKALAPIDEVRGALTKMQPQFASALPTHITPERFVRITMTAIQLNSKLLQCDRQSLYSACMRAAQDGLLPDGREGVITPYKDSAQWMPMVAGLCKKARNSGEIKTLDAQVVYAEDTYESWVDETGQHFKHQRARGERGEPILTYAYALTKDGGFFFEEIDEDQMQQIENASRAGNGPWKGPFRDEMRRKSAIRRLAKYRLPSSTDLDEIIRRDDELYDLEQTSEVNPDAAAKPSRLNKIIENQAVTEAPKTQAEPPTKVAQAAIIEEPEGPTREQLIMEVSRIGARMKMTKDQLIARAKKSFRKELTKLDIDELELLRDVLSAELPHVG